MWISIEGTIIKWNKEAEILYGYKEEEVVGKDYISSFLPRDEMQNLRKRLRRIFAGEAVRGFIHPIQARTGEIRTLIWNSTPSLSLMSEPACVIAMGQDITKLIAIEQELREEKKNTDLASQTRLVFMSNISHELKTPLNSIIGFSDLLNTSNLDKLEEDQKKSISIIQRNSKHLLGLINNVLDISRIESGLSIVNPRKFDIGDLVKSCVDLIMPQYPHHNIQVDKSR